MVTKIITDVTVITMGIVVLAILFGPHIAISISLINRTCTQLTRKLKLSYANGDIFSDSIYEDTTSKYPDLPA